MTSPLPSPSFDLLSPPPFSFELDVLSGKLTKADCDALVEGMKTGKKEGVMVFKKVVSQFAMSRVSAFFFLFTSFFSH